ncbi:aromatic amino acid DMT transporter YddG [Variovorax sp. HJSM1_2]|uniref:aromatic amino acid DMT transporter YddG n=1 Tax=Variovorax sp. HJSM1_2 TaxID=3366263 RepID=UPI003BE8AFD0
MPKTSPVLTLSIAQNRSATLKGLVAVLLWSTTVGLIRSISELLGPIGGAAMIFSVGGILAALALGVPRPASFNRIYLFVGGALFITYEIFLALSLGLATNRTQVLELGMLNYMWPCLTIVLAVMLKQQKANWAMFPGALLSFLGLVWVMKGDGDWSPAALLANLQNNPLAYGLAATAAILWAAYSVLTKRFGEGKSGVPLFLLGTALILWLLYAISPEPALRFTFSGVAQVVVMGAFMATAYSAWNYGIQKGNLTLLAVASYFTPVLSILLASVWLSTAPSASFWQGVAMVSIGSVVCWWSTRAHSRHA